MPFLNAPQTDEAITVDGTATGYVTVTSNANYYPGAVVWMRGNTVASKRYRVTDVKSTNLVGLREIIDWDDNVKRAAGPNYGRSPLVQWTVADSARISQEPSVVRVEDSTASVKVPLV